ncbi:MAG TPA: TetR/AcrR family transcriptional regulator C-terminal domain-containing protein [Actinomycetota bacterium]|nr:TetR/AcrR family transcriptional regulator C-terminal domain-containing protein [Actinomycetota bacterium]
MNEPPTRTRTRPRPAPAAAPLAPSEERPRREPLNRDRVIAAALRIMDEEGLDAVTMRRVGRELGVEAMSLYNHVRDKDDILDGIAQAVLAGFRIPEADDWAESARLTAREFRRILLAHPGVMTLITERNKPFTNPDSLQVYEHVFELFRSAGLSTADAAQAFHVFGSYILGSVTMELGIMVGGPSDEAHQEAHREMAAFVASAELPRLREAMPHLMDCDLDEQFGFGLDLLIEGLRSRASGSA